MKIRKEFLLFGAAVLVIAAIIVAVIFIGNDREHYNGDDVTLNFGDDINYYESHPVEDFEDDYKFDIFSEEDEGLNDDVITWEDTGDPDSAVVKPDVGDESGYTGSEYELNNKTNDDNEFEGFTDVTTTLEKLTPEEYVDMLVHFVCGLEDERYIYWMTGDLVDTFNTHLTEEPYMSLFGDSRYTVVNMTDTSFTFKSSYGTNYTFDLRFSGDRVSEIIAR